MFRFCSGAVVVFVASVALGAEPEGDLKALQGAWVIEEATLAGRDHKADFKGMKLTVTGEKYTVTINDITQNGTIKLDSTKTPKQIDLSTNQGLPFKGRNLPGVYELKGETVVLCLNAEMPERPTKFEAPEKTSLMLLTFKREKK
jgi:uncharacterized protein (TIGR03067 family)